MQQAGIGELVAIAWGITLFVFVGLTLFVAYSDIDFSFLGLFLPVCLLVFVLWGFTAMIFGFKLGYVYAAIGALLFSAYIIYDTFNSEFRTCVALHPCTLLLLSTNQHRANPRTCFTNCLRFTRCIVFPAL